MVILLVKRQQYLYLANTIIVLQGSVVDHHIGLLESQVENVYNQGNGLIVIQDAQVRLLLDESNISIDFMECLLSYFPFKLNLYHIF